MKTSRLVLACLLTSACALSAAQNKDVDQADTLDFQSFHKDKKEAVKVWDKTSNTPTKAYSDQSVPTNNAATKDAATNTTIAPTTVTSGAVKTNTAAAEDIHGKRFEIRERYTLTRSSQTPYSAFFVIEPLYKQAAQLCSKGWRKISERSEPIEQDFYLYYEIECL